MSPVSLEIEIAVANLLELLAIIASMSFSNGILGSF